MCPYLAHARINAHRSKRLERVHGNPVGIALDSEVETDMAFLAVPGGRRKDPQEFHHLPWNGSESMDRLPHPDTGYGSRKPRNRVNSL
jgi:hypothetical protein